MKSSAEPIAVVLVTGPDMESMRRLATEVVNERLAACVNLLPGVLSVYRWQGQTEVADEVLAVMKTVPARLSVLERRVKDLHPYDTPEFLVLSTSSGSDEYVGWVRDCIEGA